MPRHNPVFINELYICNPRNATLVHELYTDPESRRDGLITRIEALTDAPVAERDEHVLAQRLAQLLGEELAVITLRNYYSNPQGLFEYYEERIYDYQDGTC